MIRTADMNDLPILLRLAKENVAETGWGYTYNESHAMHSLVKYILCSETDILIINEGEGGVILAYDDDFQNERVGVITKFFVSKKYRKGNGRELVKACNEWFDKKGCVDSSCTDSFHPQGHRLFYNLMLKCDYAPSGTVLTRRVH